MTNRYIVRTSPFEEDLSNRDDFLEHDQDAYTRRLNYDRQKRHEKYIRDRDAGKTGFKGIRARTNNPYGNYASLYYNPEKAAEYYRTHRGASVKNPRSSTKKKKEGRSFEAAETVDGSGSGGSSGSSGSGGSGDAQAAQAARKALNDKLQKLREGSQFETAAQRKATQMKIEELRKALEKELEKKKTQREKTVERGEKERKEFREEAAKKSDKARSTRESRVKKDVENLKKTKETKINPYRKENADLRGRIDSMGKNANKALRARLLKKLATNNEKINKANADYTNSISAAKTKHSMAMRASIDKIRTKMQNSITSSSTKQRDQLKSISEEVKSLREKNRSEIETARKALNEWVSNERTRVAKETARLKGEEYKDPTAANKERENKIEARAREILGKSGSTKVSSTKGKR